MAKLLASPLDPVRLACLCSAAMSCEASKATSFAVGVNSVAGISKFKMTTCLEGEARR